MKAVLHTFIMLLLNDKLKLFILCNISLNNGIHVMIVFVCVCVNMLFCDPWDVEDRDHCSYTPHRSDELHSSRICYTL